MPKLPHVPADSLLREVIPAGSHHRELTELHVHLGGSVPIYRLWEMGMERGIRGVAGSYEDFIQLLHRSTTNTGDLDRYLEIFDTVELIQAGPTAIAEAVRIAINGAYRTGGMRKLGPGGEGGDPDPIFAITRLELRFNPMKRTGALFFKAGDRGLFDVDRIISAACESAHNSEIAYRGGIQVGLIICFGRDLARDVNDVLAEKVRTWSAVYDNIVGIDLAGPESACTLEDDDDRRHMAELFASAGSGIGKTVHVGETPHVSIDTFIKTIESLNPDRVAHPVVAARALWNDSDPRGLELLAERDICCELCVHSNLLTGAIETIEEYGAFLRTLDEYGIRYTFSTDSPALQLTTLAGELDMLLAAEAASPAQVSTALDNAEQATFLHGRRRAIEHLASSTRTDNANE
ncbi:MAG: hypothetical protein KDD44_02530 [Bdellovibrionales bacterium]|nr:hypothetical protein [Bdellovibrionales bacterium]